MSALYSILRYIVKLHGALPILESQSLTLGEERNSRKSRPLRLPMNSKQRTQRKKTWNRSKSQSAGDLTSQQQLTCSITGVLFSGIIFLWLRQAMFRPTMYDEWPPVSGLRRDVTFV